MQRQLHLLEDLAYMVILGSTGLHWISQTDYLNTVRPLVPSSGLAGAQQPLKQNLQWYFADLAADISTAREYPPNPSVVYARPADMHSLSRCPYTGLSLAELAVDVRGA